MSIFWENENTAGLANKSTINTSIRALSINSMKSFNLDLAASSPWDEIRNLTAGKLLVTPLLRVIR
ncbi:MAG: hypothetical protein DHS20C13_12260 [Thermodesulfobacteriota bacterium]|nr:MAG: hypothetical protein DHS20C13_12260 [Thermodesulfobacteriota bacterium]